LEGNPVAGVWVNFDMDEVVLRVRLRSDRVSRAALTNAEGDYQLDPIPPGRYRVMVQDRSWDDRHESEHIGEPLKAAFPTGTYFTSIAEGREVLPIHAVRDISLHVRFFDSSGKPARGGPVMIEGTFRGQPYMTWGRLDSEGKVNAKVPRGLEQARIQPFARAGQSLRYRRGKTGALHDPPKWNLGTLNEDLTDLEVIVYRRPKLTINAVDDGGAPLKDFVVRIDYAAEAIKTKPVLQIANSERVDGQLTRNPDGSAQQVQLLPDEDFTVTVEAEGYRPASQSLKLREGETKVLELRLNRR